MSEYVYVVQYHYDYEGDVIVGVYSSKQRADTMRRKVEETGYGDYTTVERFEVNSKQWLKEEW